LWRGEDTLSSKANVSSRLGKMIATARRIGVND
jgi:hypothetical protein